MKTKCLLMCLIFIVCTAQVQARPDHKIYLPLFIFPKMDGTMGLWSYVEPEVAINLITNSSFETNTAGWLGSGNNTIARTSDQQKFGVYSLECTQGEVASLVMAQYAITFPVAGTYTLSAWIYLTPTWDAGAVSLRFRNFAGSTIVTASTSVSATGNWTRIALTVAVVGGDLVGNLDVILTTAVGNNEIAYVDAVDCVLSPYATTHVDGDQPGCEWNGAEHASTSQRSALSRAGGRVINFDDLNFDISGMFGAGMSPITVKVDPFAILPGAEINSIKTDERTFTLSGWVTGESLEDLHANRQAIIDALKPNAVPGNQPVLLRYTGAVLTKEIAATYEAGLAGTIRGEFPCLEQNFTLRFLAADPNWYEIGNSAAVLVTEDTATLRYLAGRLRSTGQWDDLGLTANPTANGTIRAILVASDKSVYFGGNFDGIDGNVPAGGDYIIRFDPTDQSFNLLVGASDLNGQVNAIVEGPNGIIYLGGSFTAVNGVGTADYVVSYDPIADTWASLGDPDSGTAVITTVWTMAFDSLGNLYVGGNFINWANVANADYFAMWTGAAWTTPGGIATGGTGQVITMAIDEINNIYIGGAFVNWNGDGDADSLAWYDGTVWASLNATALNNSVLGMIYDTPNRLLYLGGYFTNGAGIADADYIMTWNRQTFAAVGSGLTGGVGVPGVFHMDLAPDGTLYIVGNDLSAAGGVTLSDSIAKWTGASWAHVDVALPGAPIIYAIEHSEPDPVIDANFDLWIGFTTTGAGTFSGIATVANEGTTEAFPIISIQRTGGTSARIKQVRNEALGLELLFDYALLDGETLTIDLRPTEKSVVSTFFVGSRLDAVLKNSDLGTWHLGPGDNPITCFVDVAGVPTIVGTLEWRDPYWAAD